MATPTTNAVAWDYVSPNTATDGAQYLLSGYRWGVGGLGVGVDLTFSFPGQTAHYEPGYGNNEWSSYYGLDVASQNAVKNALSAWSVFTNIRFSQSADNASTVGELRFAESDVVGDDAAAYAWYPHSEPEAGDVWINPDYWNTDGGSVAFGSFDFNVLLHEIGHALGLKHSFNDDDGSSPPYMPSQLDSYKYSVMSYTAWAGSGDNYASFYPTTPMYYDIVAIQALYGVKTTYKTGNDVYTFNQGTTYFQTIYDAGGTDGIVFSGTRGCVINLNDGAFSSLSDWISFSNGVSSNATVCIGPNTIIENATGGNGNDLLVGNAANNILNGRAGADKMSGGAGNDIYYVDRVNDVVTEGVSAGIDTVRTVVSTTLGANVENLALTGAAAINGVGNALANSIIGNNAVNFINAGAGADVIRGLGGNDVLFGGAGADIFVFNTALGAGNIDRIGDFNVADDTMWLDNSVFSRLFDGALPAYVFQVGAAAADPTDRIIYNSNTGALLYDINGNAAGGAVQFATLAAGLALTQADFLVI